MMIIDGFGFGSQLIGLLFSVGILSFGSGVKAKLLGVAILSFSAIHFMGADVDDVASKTRNSVYQIN